MIIYLSSKDITVVFPEPGGMVSSVCVTSGPPRIELTYLMGQQ